MDFVALQFASFFWISSINKRRLWSDEEKIMQEKPKQKKNLYVALGCIVRYLDSV